MLRPSFKGSWAWILTSMSRSKDSYHGDLLTYRKVTQKMSGSYKWDKHRHQNKRKLQKYSAPKPRPCFLCADPVGVSGGGHRCPTGKGCGRTGGVCDHWACVQWHTQSWAACANQRRLEVRSHRPDVPGTWLPQLLTAPALQHY